MNLNATDRREAECNGDFTDRKEPASGKGRDDPTEKEENFGSASLSVRGVLSPLDT